MLLGIMRPGIAWRGRDTCHGRESRGPTDSGSGERGRPCRAPGSDLDLTPIPIEMETRDARNVHRPDGDGSSLDRRPRLVDLWRYGSRAGGDDRCRWPESRDSPGAVDW